MARSALNYQSHLMCLVDEDKGLYKFIEKFTSIEKNLDTIKLQLISEIRSDKYLSKKNVFINEKKCGEYETQEIFNKILTSKIISTSNATDLDERFPIRRSAGPFIKSLSEADKIKLDKQKTQLNSVINSLAKKHQKDITDLFGKLVEKYNVGLSVPTFNFENIPFDVTLGDKDFYTFQLMIGDAD